MLRFALSILAVMLAAGPALANGDDSPLPLDVTWEWVSFTTPVEEITVDHPENYTLIFDANNHVAVRVDCNRGSGSYTITDNRIISFGPMALTRMMCPPESLSDRFVREVTQSHRFFLQDGNLYLELPIDAGTLRFQPQE